MKNLKKFVKKNAVTLTVIPLALLLVLGAFGFVKAQLVPQTVVIENVEHLVMNVAGGLGEMAFGAITQDKSTFDHGIEILAEGLDITGGDLNVDGTSDFSAAITADRIFDGGTVTNASTTLTVARALTAAEVCDSSIITVNSAAVAATVSASSLDITLPSTTTLWALCLAEEGSHVSFFYSNLSPTAASTTQIVAGTGMDLLEAGDGSVTNIEIGGGDRAKIEIWRQTGLETGTLDAYTIVTEYSAAD